jgi:hypothetical protein
MKQTAVSGPDESITLGRGYGDIDAQPTQLDSDVGHLTGAVVPRSWAGKYIQECQQHAHGSVSSTISLSTSFTKSCAK